MKTPPSLEDSAAEPVKYTGADQTDKRFHHGRLRHAVGVHRYQAFRANRTRPDEEGETGWTYNYQPSLAWWNNRFYLQYLSNLLKEHKPPGRTLLSTSEDGRTWSGPRVIFPEYALRYPLPNAWIHWSVWSFARVPGEVMCASTSSTANPDRRESIWRTFPVATQRWRLAFFFSIS